jgi:hypothetical protein
MLRGAALLRTFLARKKITERKLPESPSSRKKITRQKIT